MTESGDRFFSSAFLSPAEIYHQLTQGAGPADLQRVQAQIQLEAPEEEDRANLIASLGELIATGWQGQASAAAYGPTLALRDRVRDNADNVVRAEDLLSRQLGSFATAYNSVRPVPDVPEQRLDEPVPFDVDHAKEVALYQLVAQHNIDVFGQYDGASEYNETNMPQEFHAGGRDGGDVSVRSADTIEVGEPRASGEPRATGGDGSPGSGWPGGGSSGYPGSAGGFPSESGGISGGSGGLSGGSGGISGGVGAGAGSGGASGELSGVTGASSVLPSGGGQGSGYDHRGGGSSGPGYSSSLPGAVVGGGSGGGDSGGAPRMSGGAVAGPVVRGPGNAVGAGALAAEENAARRGVAAAGARGGAGPVGAPLGAGRGKDDEDTEHERKVLLEVDSEETFGSDVLTAPPVIGDDEYED